MSLVSLSQERERREADAWERYVQAKVRADATHDIEDGRLAARAWCAFLDLYQTPSQNAFMGSTVHAFGRRS